MPPWLVIGISGVTCGGKTTLAVSLRDYFKGLRGAPLWNTPYIIGDVQLISQDDYFLPVNDFRHKWNEKLNAINFELITSLDMKQMITNIAWIIKGHYVETDPSENIDFTNEVPNNTYTNFEHYALRFQQQYQQYLLQNSNYIRNPNNTTPHSYQPQQTMQSPQQPTTQRLQSALHSYNNANCECAHPHTVATQVCEKRINILIIEGFMIFNQPELLAICSLKFHFHLPYEKCYERRRKRTYDPPDVTGYFEMCVWPHYEKNFAEYRDCKDIIFLNGEISKEKIFKFVMQRIVSHFEQSSEKACPTPQKLISILDSIYSSNNGNSNSNNDSGDGNNSCPMEQQ